MGSAEVLPPLLRRGRLREIPSVSYPYRYRRLRVACSLNSFTAIGEGLATPRVAAKVYSTLRYFAPRAKGMQGGSKKITCFWVWVIFSAYPLKSKKKGQEPRDLKDPETEGLGGETVHLGAAGGSSSWGCPELFGVRKWCLLVGGWCVPRLISEESRSGPFCNL